MWPWELSRVDTMKIFSLDGPVYRGLEKLFNLMLLHILWIVCSIPVFTIGASTTALFAVMLKLVKGEEGYIVKTFFRAFRDNFKKSTIIWLCFLAAILWCVGMIVISLRTGDRLLKTFALAEAALLVLLTGAMQYVFAVQAYFENTVRNTIRNSFWLSLRFLPYTAAMLAFVTVPVLITGFVDALYPVMLFLWSFWGSSLIAMGDSHMLNKIFQQVTQ